MPYRYMLVQSVWERNIREPAGITIRLGLECRIALKQAIDLGPDPRAESSRIRVVVVVSDDDLTDRLNAWVGLQGSNLMHWRCL